jgi:hypothetical protein
MLAEQFITSRLRRMVPARRPLTLNGRRAAGRRRRWLRWAVMNLR